jgi:hypothetical protein
MAKKKSVSRAPSKAPSSVGQAVVIAAAEGINDKVCYDYCSLVMAPPTIREKTSKTKRIEQTHAVMKLASLGFAFYQWCNENVPDKLGKMPPDV